MLANNWRPAHPYSLKTGPHGVHEVSLEALRGVVGKHNAKEIKAAGTKREELASLVF